jgi:hypothetical protein
MVDWCLQTRWELPLRNRQEPYWAKLQAIQVQPYQEQPYQVQTCLEQPFQVQTYLGLLRLPGLPMGDHRKLRSTRHHFRRPGCLEVQRLVLREVRRDSKRRILLPFPELQGRPEALLDEREHLLRRANLQLRFVQMYCMVR